MTPDEIRQVIIAACAQNPLQRFNVGMALDLARNELSRVPEHERADSPYEFRNLIEPLPRQLQKICYAIAAQKNRF